MLSLSLEGNFSKQSFNWYCFSYIIETLFLELKTIYISIDLFFSRDKIFNKKLKYSDTVLKT